MTMAAICQLLMGCVVLSMLPQAMDAIVNGSFYDIPDAPWALCLKELIPERKTYRWDFRCSAALTDLSWALTARHCIEDTNKGCDKKGSFWAVEGGMTFLGSGVTADVRKIYCDSSNDVDIALLRLTRGIKEVGLPSIVPIQIIEASTNYHEDQCSMAGFGRAEIEPSDELADLHGASVTEANTSWCNTVMPDALKAWQLCVVGSGNNARTCHGDSGSALACRDDEGNYKLVGINAGDQDDYYCAPRPSDYSVYAKVRDFHTFIDTKTRDTFNSEVVEFDREEEAFHKDFPFQYESNPYKPLT